MAISNARMWTWLTDEAVIAQTNLGATTLVGRKQRSIEFRSMLIHPLLTFVWAAPAEASAPNWPELLATASLWGVPHSRDAWDAR